MNPIGKNPLITKDDLKRATMDILKPLLPLYTEDKSRVYVGVNTAHYSDSVAATEAFCRPLWALAPLFTDGSGEEFAKIYRQGLASGTNPKALSYWGEPNDHDQLLVEMAAIGLALILAPEKVWEPLNDIEKDNLCNWLDFVNTKILEDNNWRLFAVMVNLGLKNVGRPYNADVMNESLEFADKLYLENGWYSDGIQLHCDYYVAFAIHFYLLIYAKNMENEDRERCEKIKKRAREFANDFIEFFHDDGSAIAYGRSMTYRFAQTAFWSAYAYANVGGIDLGVVKGIILRNLRWWFEKPIWNNDGSLSVGYGYPSIIMSEGYNSHGSPYWALKSMLILALAENSEFWKCEEKPLPKSSGLRMMKSSNLAVQRLKSHSVLYSAGFKSAEWLAHCGAKYDKFAYSSKCGFCVPKSTATYSMAGGDNALLLRETGGNWTTKKEPVSTQLTDEWIRTDWTPYNNVTIKTYIVPFGEWHIRVHFLSTERPLETSEGGFSTPLGESYIKDNRAVSNFGADKSVIVNLLGDRTPEIVGQEPNTNLIYNHTQLPILKGSLPVGKSILACGVFFGEDDSDIPTVEIKNQNLIISLKEQKVSIVIDE